MGSLEKSYKEIPVVTLNDWNYAVQPGFIKWIETEVDLWGAKNRQPGILRLGIFCLVLFHKTTEKFI